jgi:hypothetical protein
MTAKRIGSATLLVLATIFTTAAIFGIWAQRQALDTDNWVTTSTGLLQDEKIRNALGVAIVDRLYDTSAVEERLKETLPPRLDRLAAPAAAGLKQIALRNAPRLLGTQAALTAWEAANRQAHRVFVDVVEGKVAKNGEVTLNVQELVRQVAAGTGLPAGTADKLPPSVAQLQVLKSDQIATAQDAVRGFKDAMWVLIVLALLCFGGAIALSADRRRTVVSVGWCLIVAAIAVFALRRVGGHAVVGALADAPNARGVADEAWAIATSLLVDAAQGALLLGVLVASGAWLAGPGRVATSVRRASAPVYRDRPGVARAGLALGLLLLVLWSPVPWTGRVVPVLIVTIGAFAWLEWLRHRTLEEFPDVGPGEFGRMMRSKGRFGTRREAPDDTVPSG